MKVSIRSEKQAIKVFLEELKDILMNKDFDVDNNLTVISSEKSEEKEKFSTPYTLLDLEYDTYDIVDRLKELELGDYSETLFDKDDNNPPLLYVFGKNINFKQVYIKLKIKGEGQKRYYVYHFIMQKGKCTSLMHSGMTWR